VNMECMFSLENGSVIEMVPDASEFLRSTLNIRNYDSALYIASKEGRFLVDGYIIQSKNSFGYSLSIMSYVLNCIVEILLILTYDLGLADQTMNDSHF
jgi:hypothetical protein